MEIFSVVLFVLVAVAFVFVVLRVFSKGGDAKPTGVKKSEIIEDYEKQMRIINERYADDKDVLISQKTIFLKSVSGELHRNIFFDEQEAKEVVQYLASL